MNSTQGVPVAAIELADIKARASSIVTPWAKTVLRLVGEIERLRPRAECPYEAGCPWHGPQEQV